MPKRTINTRRNKAATADAATATDAAPATDAVTDAVATADAAPATDATDAVAAPADAADLPADIDPAIANDSDLSTAEKLFLHSLPADPAPATADITPEAVAKPATPDAKAEFLERKSAATLSAIPLYNGPSLSVHRSDKQPAAAAYLERVASPVQKAKSATVRDDSALLTYYDHLTTYHGGDYTSGFNPDRFGADLGALSRNASLNRVTLTDCGQHVQLTPLGITQARNLVAKRNKA